MNENLAYEEKISFTEIYDLIMFLNDEEKSKIPKKFIKYVEYNRLGDYITNVNPYIPLEYQNVKKQTRIVMAYVYRVYLADEEEKAIFREQEQKEYLEEQKILQEKERNMFKQVPKPNIAEKNTIEKTKEVSNLPIVKESFFDKIKNIIKKIFKK